MLIPGCLPCWATSSRRADRDDPGALRVHALHVFPGAPRAGGSGVGHARTARHPGSGRPDRALAAGWTSRSRAIRLFHAAIWRKGDLGESIRKSEPVSTVIGDRIGRLSSWCSMRWCWRSSSPCRWRPWRRFNKERWPDQRCASSLLSALAMPAYWVGMMLLQFLAVKYRIFPVAGYGDGFSGHLNSLFLPALSLALAISALMIRSLRIRPAGDMASDYVRTARAKGLDQPRDLHLACAAQFVALDDHRAGPELRVPDRRHDHHGNDLRDSRASGS